MTTTNPTPAIIVKTALSTSDEAPIIDVLFKAFSADPAARFLWRDDQQYSRHFPDFLRAFGGRAFAHKSAFYVEGYSGAALWLPPNVHPDQDELMTVLNRSVSGQLQEAAFKVFEKMASYHPSEPHWYLPVIGVNPQKQGKGLGRALMQHALTQCDREGRPAYLESSNPTNIPFYEGFGFELLGKIPIEAGPVIFPMLRKPR